MSCSPMYSVNAGGIACAISSRLIQSIPIAGSELGAVAAGTVERGVGDEPRLVGDALAGAEHAARRDDVLMLAVGWRHDQEA